MKWKQLLCASIFVLLFWHSSNSQADTVNCSYVTDGSGNSLGIRMKIGYRCKWRNVKESNKTVVAAYSFDMPDSGRIGCALIISKPQELPSNAEKEEIYKMEWAKDVFKTLGEIISIKKVEINKYNWAEYIFSATRDTKQGKVYEYITAYYSYVGDCNVMLTYKTIALDDAISAILYIEYLGIFRDLANGLTIYGHK